MKQEKKGVEIKDKVQQEAVRQLKMMEEAKDAVKHGDKIVVAVPMGELIDLYGIPFTIGRVKKGEITLKTVRGYELMKETAAQRMERLRQGE